MDSTHFACDEETWKDLHQNRVNVRHQDSCNHAASDSKRQGTMVPRQRNIRQDNEKPTIVVFFGGSRPHETQPAKSTTGVYSGTGKSVESTLYSDRDLGTMTVASNVSGAQNHLSPPSASVIWLIPKRKVCCDVENSSKLSALTVSNTTYACGAALRDRSIMLQPNLNFIRNLEGDGGGSDIRIFSACLIEVEKPSDHQSCRASPKDVSNVPVEQKASAHRSLCDDLLLEQRNSVVRFALDRYRRWKDKTPEPSRQYVGHQHASQKRFTVLRREKVYIKPLSPFKEINSSILKRHNYPGGIVICDPSRHTFVCLRAKLSQASLFGVTCLGVARFLWRTSAAVQASAQALVYAGALVQEGGDIQHWSSTNSTPSTGAQICLPKATDRTLR
ncbi:hypothetical protein CGCF413_v006564 [Colletotrichum fructicola]|nr:hypothetical protein CGCF413_v006564 [Colletotrichum fructicola]